MLSDDVFRSRLNATIEALRYWVPTVSDTAQIQESSGDGFWKLALTPHAREACPFELVLRLDQRHDLTIADELFEDEPTDTLELFVPLVTAITEGRVIQRLWSTRATGTPCALETHVRLQTGEDWVRCRILNPVASPGADATTHRDRTFLPYRR